MTENDKSAPPQTAHHHPSLPDVSLAALAKLAAPIFVANLALMGSATIDTIMAEPRP